MASGRGSGLRTDLQEKRKMGDEGKGFGRKVNSVRRVNSVRKGGRTADKSAKRG